VVCNGVQYLRVHSKSISGMLIYVRKSIDIYSRQTDSSAAGDAFYRGDLIITLLSSVYPDAD